MREDPDSPKLLAVWTAADTFHYPETDGIDSAYFVAYQNVSTHVYHFVSGTVASSDTWSGDIYINGDLFIPDSVTLTIEQGSKLYFVPGFDYEKAGADTSLSEIVVAGKLFVRGTDTHGVL